MTKCSLFIVEPPGMDIGIVGFFGVLLPEYLPEGFEFCLRPWDDRDVSICVKVTKVEFTIIGGASHMGEGNAHTAVFAEPVMDKTKATPEEWREFSETADS